MLSNEINSLSNQLDERNFKVLPCQPTHESHESTSRLIITVSVSTRHNGAAVYHLANEIIGS